MSDERILEEVKIIVEMDTSRLSSESKELANYSKKAFADILKAKEKFEAEGNKKGIQETQKRLKTELQFYKDYFKQLEQGDLQRRKELTLYIEQQKQAHQTYMQQQRERITQQKIEHEARMSQERTYRQELRKREGGTGGIFGAAKNITRYATAAFLTSPYLLALTAISGQIKETITNTLELNKSLYKLAAITKATPADMKAMGDSIRYVTGELNYSNKETVDYMITLSRMGVEAENIAKVSKSIAELAKISGSDLGKTGELVVQTMNAFGKSFSDTDYVVNQMNRTINGSALDMEKYATILGYVSAAASEVDVTFEQANSMISLLANSGLKASTVGTSLRNILGELTKDGDSLTDALKRLKDQGLSYADAMELVGKRSANALTILIDKFDQLQVSQAKALADITTTTSQVKLTQESPVEKISKAKNKVTTALELAMGGQISRKDALSQLNGSEKQAFALNLISNLLQENVGADFLSMTVQEQSKFIEDNVRAITAEDPQLISVLGLGSGVGINKARLDKFVTNIVSGKQSELVKSKTEQAVSQAADKLKKIAKTGKFSTAYQKAGGGEAGNKAYNDAVYATSELELRSIFQDAGLAVESITEDMIKSVSGLGITKFANVESKVYRVGELRTGMKGLQGMGANQEAINQIRKFQEEEKKLIEEICIATNNTHPFCIEKGKGGNKEKVLTFDEVAAQIVGLGIREEINAAKDAVQALITERNEKIKAIEEYAGTEYYEKATKRIDEKFSRDFADVEEKFFGENGIVTNAQKGDIELINNSFDLLEKVRAQVTSSIAKKFKGRESTNEYKNAIAKANKDYETLKQRITSAQTGNVSLIGSARSSLTNKARREIVRDKSTRFDTTAEQERYTDLLAQIASFTSEASVELARLEAELQSIKNQTAGTLDPFKRNKLESKAEGVQKQIWEKEKSVATQTLELYKKAEEVVKERKKKIEDELKNVEMEADISNMSISLMEEGDVALARFGGAKTRDEAYAFVEARKKKQMAQGNAALSTTNRELANIAKQKGKAEETAVKENPATRNALEAFKEYMPSMEELSNFAVDLYTQQQERMLQATLDRINKEIEAEQEKVERENSINSGALELGLISQGEYARRKEELEENFIKKKDALMKKAFEAEKKAEAKMAVVKGAQRLAEIALNVYVAESKKGAFGLATAAAAIAAFTPLAVAQTAAEVAAINKREYVPQKFSRGGLIQGEPHSRGGVPFTVNGKSGFEAEGGEFIVRKSSTSKYFNELTQINNDTFDRNSYYYNNEALVERLDILINQNSRPLRAFVSENDLRNDEVARKTKQNRATV